MVGIKMKGIPFKLYDDEVESFFKDFGHFHGSVKFGSKKRGKTLGVGVILFKND